MASESFRRIVPGLCGCLAGAVFLVLVSVPILFVLAWSGSHCEPAPECRRSAEVEFAVVEAVAAALAVLLGFAVRALVRWWNARDPGTAGRAPLWAGATVLVLAAVALWSGSLWLG